MAPYGSELEVKDESAFITTDAKAVGAMAFVSERGPVGEPRLSTSVPEFERIYGGPVEGHVGYHVAKRALEAGCALWSSRVVHVATPADLDTRASVAAEVTAPDRAPVAGPGQVVGTGTFPLRLSPGQTLVASVSGGGDQTATFRATPATITGASATYDAVTSGHRLVLLINGVQRAVFFTAENDQAEYLATINAQITGAYAADQGGQVRLVTDRKGSGAAIAVHADTHPDVLTSLGLAVGAGVNAGPNNVSDVDAVTAAEYEAIVEAAIPGTAADEDATHHPRLRTVATGAGVSVRVQPGSTALAFGFDTAGAHAGTANVAVPTLRFYGSSDGTWAHGLRVVVDDDPRDPDARFRVRITDANGRLVAGQEFAGLTVADPEDPFYVVTALAEGECLFLAEDLHSGATAPANRPLAGTYAPTGGNDGLGGLTAADFVGDPTARTGVHAFDTVVSGFRLVATPGMTDHDAQQSIDGWVAARQDCRYITSVPLSVTTKAGAVAYRRRTGPFATGTSTNSACTALYAGWHEVQDPVSRRTFWLPVDGEVFAAMARGAAGDGVWSAPAGGKRARIATGLGGIRKPRVLLSDADMRALQDAGVNAIFRDPTAGWVIEGQKTLQLQASALDRLNVGILTDFIGESLIWGLRSERYEPNDPQLWRELRNRAERFMESLAGKRGTVSAFKVVCDASINTAEVIEANRTRVHVFFTPVKTSEEQIVRLIVTAEGVKLDADAA